MKKILLGMMAVAITCSAMAQTSDNSSDRNQQQKEWHKHHSKDGNNLSKLNLTPDQKSQVKTINESFKQQMHDLNKQGSITVDEQKQKREELLKDRKEKIEAILTPEQKQQAEAMRQSFKGGREGHGRERLNNLTKDLNLTADQSTKINAVNEAFRTNFQEIRKNSALSEEEKKEQMKSLQKQHRSEIEALLTSDQKEQLKDHLKNRPSRTAVK